MAGNEVSGNTADTFSDSQRDLRFNGHNTAKLALNFIPELALPEMLGCLLPARYSACKIYGLKSSHTSPPATPHLTH